MGARVTAGPAAGTCSYCSLLRLSLIRLQNLQKSIPLRCFGWTIWFKAIRWWKIMHLMGGWQFLCKSERSADDASKNWNESPVKWKSLESTIIREAILHNNRFYMKSFHKMVTPPPSPWTSTHSASYEQRSDSEFVVLDLESRRFVFIGLKKQTLFQNSFLKFFVLCVSLLMKCIGPRFERHFYRSFNPTTEKKIASSPPGSLNLPLPARKVTLFVFYM